MAKSLTNLRSLTRFYALGDSTSTAFGDTDILIGLNGRYQDAFLLATTNDGDFQFNGDGSQSINITSGTRAYSLATDLFKVNRVEVKYPVGAVEYQRARPIDGEQIEYYGKDNYTPSIPEVDFMGDKIEIFVSAKTADISAITAGIKVYYQKELTELTAGTDEIIFPDVFARFISIGAAMDYCGVNGLNARLKWLEGEYQKQEARLTLYVADRQKAKRMALTTKGEDYGAGQGTYGISDRRIE